VTPHHILRSAPLLALGLLLTGAATRADTLAIVGARAYPGTAETEHANLTIVIRDGRIAAVGAGLAPPAGAKVIDARGDFVTTGLMNAATQLGIVEVDSVPDTNDQGVASGPLGAAFDVEFAFNPNSTSIALARADGVTLAGIAPTAAATVPFAGLGAVLRLAPGAARVERPKAMMFAQVGGMSASRAGGSRSAQWVLLRNALEEARAFGHGRAPGVPRDQLLSHLDAEALQPVLAGQIPLAIYAARESDVREAIRLATDFRLRVVVVGGAEAWRAAPALAAAHVAVVLDPFQDYPATFDELGARLDNAALLERAGVTIAFTLPAIQRIHNAGSALREAAGIAVANGLPRAAALRALTVNPARIWGVDGRFGTLAPGQDGDLVIWDGDPLEPASAPVAVIVGGEVCSTDTRQQRLRERYAPAARNDAWPPAYR
jgi:imidazolonepropionase-like amidohydrolase